MQKTGFRAGVVLLFVFLIACTVVAAQKNTVPLWNGAAPGSDGKGGAEAIKVTPQGEHVYSSIHRPSITVYLPPKGKASGAGVLVIPGGGHREIWMDHEGFNVAEWLSQHGIAAFVLKYRLAREPGSTYSVEGTELADAKRAMRVIRSRATEWEIDPSRLGVIGFSAGGELAALLSTKTAPVVKPASTTDDIDRLSSKPAFQALIYPSIPQNMPLSNSTPPAFLLCGANDEDRISVALPGLYIKMKRAGIPVELHVLAGVGHGFGIRATNPANVTDWPDLLYHWLQVSGLVKHQGDDVGSR